MLVHRQMLAWLQPPLDDEALSLEQPTSLLISRTLVFMCAVGATLVLVTTLTSDAPSGSKLGVIAVACIAYVVMVAMAQTRRGLSPRALERLHYVCQALAGAMIAFTGDPGTAYGIFFVWLGLHAAYFLPPLHALGEIVFGAACYAIGMLAAGGFELILWALVMGTIAVFGTLTALVKVRANELLARLSHVARTDALTGLLNQRAFAEALAEQLELSRAGGGLVSLLMADADRFKEVNDRLGHLAGDDVLEGLGDLIRAQLRTGDVAGRVGGEEFAVLLPGIGCDTACAIADRLRAAVEERFAGAAVPVTMSVGAAEFPLDGHDVRSLMNAADQAMYRAKADGRNRVKAHREDAVLLGGPRGSRAEA